MRFFLTVVSFLFLPALLFNQLIERMMNTEKFRNACEAASQTFAKLNVEQYADLQSKLEFCIGSFDHDKNPSGLIEYGRIALQELKAYKEKNPRKVNMKVITDLENMTGIKAHTLRIWEKRYNLIQPFRTETNIRYYDNDQMRKLVNVAALMRSGMKISKISALTAQQMEEEISKRLSGSSDPKLEFYEVYIARLLNAGLEFDEYLFNKTYSNAIIRYGMHACYEHILIPLMHRVGLYWTTNRMNPAQEHFVTNLVKQKLYSAIDSLPPATSAQQPALLFLPQNENHELGLLMAKYILLNAGRQVIYLGANVPFVNLRSTFRETQPAQMLFFIIQMHPLDELQQYLDQVAKEFETARIFVSGLHHILSNLTIPDNIKWITSPHEFDKMLS